MPPSTLLSTWRAGVLALALLLPPLMTVPDAAAADSLPDTVLEKLAEESRADAARTLGYPGNQRIPLKDFYVWYVESGLATTLLNNAGDPFAAHGSLNSLAIERGVIEFFAPLYGFDRDNLWGLVTASGTDGNNHGIYFGRKLLKNRTGKDPILYVSRESHYSNMRLADLQNMECRLVDCDEEGRMLPEALRKALDPSRPALVVFSVGTTFKGAVDDQKALNAVLDEVKPVAVHRHVDAALFGGYLPYTEGKDIVNARVAGFDSIAVSGHKFFGLDEPCGIFLTRKDVLAAQSAFEIAYLNGSMPMISCSRSGLAPLKLHWVVKTMGVDGFTEQAKTILDNAAHLEKRLKDMGWKVWRGPLSNTVYFARPSGRLMEKYTLAPEYDERLGGELAHVVVMQHCTRDVLDAFADDLEAELAKRKAESR